MSSKIIAGTTSGTALNMSADTSGVLEIQTGSGPTTAITVDASQNVGIGITPISALSISRAAGVNAFVEIAGGANTLGSTSMLVGQDSGATGYCYNRATAPLVFGTANAEKMRLDSSGNLQVNTTTGTGKIVVNQTSTSVSGINTVTPVSFGSIVYYSQSNSTASTGWFHFAGQSSGATVNNILIYGNGNVANANNIYGGISDIKLKENIVDVSPKLKKLMDVKVRNYNLIGDYEQHKQIGVIAQELEQVFPSLVEETADKDAEGNDLGTTTKSVKYSVFVPMLIKAIQELNAKVTALEAQLGAK